MRLMEWLFPANARCMGCDGVRLQKEGPPFCPDCRKRLEKILLPKPLCGWCGYPMQGNECLFCKGGYAKHIHWIGAPYLYRRPIQRALPRLKYSGWGQVLPFLGESMAKVWQENGHPDPDIVTFVPMMPGREKRRGGNQARKLCEAFAAHMGWEITPVLRRIRQVKSQVGLTRGQRKGNLRGCFQVDGDVRGKYVLLVDDVVTTGATVAECARMLIKAGATQVWVMAAALSLKKK